MGAAIGIPEQVLSGSMRTLRSKRRAARSITRFVGIVVIEFFRPVERLRDPEIADLMLIPGWPKQLRSNVFYYVPLGRLIT